MKKINIYIVILVALICSYSCNDEWKDELYTNMVSFKAPIDKNDVSIVYLRYKPEGEVIYKLPVIVSGSTQNKKDFDVRIGVDMDTLDILNVAKYSHRKDLYYQQLPDTYYEFPSPTCKIAAGTDVETFDIQFKFVGLDLVEKWVLPLKIEDDPSYVPNMYKGRRKALLWIIPFNDYSGTYAATGMNIYFGKETQQLVVGTREARVVDEESIFFYAGNVEENSEERADYKIIVKFEEAEQKEDKYVGNLSVRAENDLINFKLLSTPTYEVWEEMDPIQPFLKHRYVTMNMKYSYDDITSSSSGPLPYRCEGSMLLERKIDVLAPDEDQAILW